MPKTPTVQISGNFSNVFVFFLNYLGIGENLGKMF